MFHCGTLRYANMNDSPRQFEFRSGITVLDKQYQKAFELFNQLSSAITFRDTSHLELIAGKIYKQFHLIYDYEQPLLDNKNTLATEKNRSFAQLFDRIDGLMAEMMDGDKLTAARKLHFEIKSWFKLHLIPMPYYRNDCEDTAADTQHGLLTEWIKIFNKSAKH